MKIQLITTANDGHNV